MIRYIRVLLPLAYMLFAAWATCTHFPGELPDGRWENAIGGGRITEPISLEDQHGDDEVFTPIPSSKVLPESCAVVAAIALKQLTDAGIWARPLGVKVKMPNYETKGHILTIFQMGGYTYAYDKDGSHRLPTYSTDREVITAKIQKILQPGWKILGSYWLDDPPTK